MACEGELAPMGADESPYLGLSWVGVGLCGFGVFVLEFRFFFVLADVYTELYDADRAGGGAG